MARPDDTPAEGPPRPALRQGLRNTAGRPPDRANEGDDWPGFPDEPPPAGPHETPDQTDREKTPGTGALPEEPTQGDEADPASG
jgi:hypothetical protein